MKNNGDPEQDQKENDDDDSDDSDRLDDHPDLNDKNSHHMLNKDQVFDIYHKCF